LASDPAAEGQITERGDLAVQVQAARQDKHALNMLLREYMPFIKKCVAGVFFKGQSKADNLTEAMLAFSGSVQTYNPDQGAFIQYAAVVIRNRLIDSARKELLVQKRFFPLPAASDQEDTAWETGISLQAYNRAEEEENLRLEIEEVNREFAKWGFSWTALLKKCPKQERSRRIAARAAETVRQDAGLLAETLKTRLLPVSRLAGLYPRKALEKYRHYIAALIILSQGDYPYIYSFLPNSFAAATVIIEEKNT